MKSTIECYNKVNKDCFKFIKSQETAKEKFKNKEKMIKSFLIPISFWIASKAKNKKPFIVGLGGGQGIGKTTITSIISIVLKKYFKLKVFKISTHDVSSMFSFFKRAKSKNFRALKLPKFNKAIDDRYNKKLWHSIKKKPDIIIFEGWCVGARAEKNNSLKKAINSLERNSDKKLIWRKFVNQQLKLKYKKLYTELDCMLFLKANNFRLLQQWRLKQEKKLWLKNKRSRNNKIMNKKDVIKFMQTYQRITQNMLKHAPKYSSMILNLNRNHQIKSVKYKL